MDERDLEHSNSIAIVGLAGRFPGAANVAEFWSNLCNGAESIRPFTPDELAACGVTGATLKDPAYVNAGAPLDGADCFDAGFFGYLPREAELMDPQHRILLECAWSALEDAGYDPDQYDGDIGVFTGVARNTYFLQHADTYKQLMQSGATYDATLGSDKDYSATRIAYQLNLNGPAMSIQTACSSSGVAVHVACQALLNGECDMAMAGGARVQVPLTAGYRWVEGGIPSPDGHCRPFDKDANGTVYGSGAAIVVLKRLENALEDGDHIYSLILGSAVNNDGADKVGFTAPSVQGQTAVIESALGMANVDPETIGYVETHGTGTSLGDPIEIAALTNAYSKFTDRRGYCAIGSLKSNIGHLDAGACVGGLIKASLMLQHKKLVPSLHFEEPNPQIDFDNSPFFVSTTTRDWDAKSGPRRAAISAFGLGGTNFHAILEEAPVPAPSSDAAIAWRPLFQSARSTEALDAVSDELADFLDKNGDLDFDDASYTLAAGRSALPHRRVTVASTPRDAASSLSSRQSTRTVTAEASTTPSKIVFLFSGQGTQYPGMGRDLYEHEPVFRDVVDQCCKFLDEYIDVDLKSLIFGISTNGDGKKELINQTNITQPALFVLEYALARLWISKGVIPDAVAGHSIGEIIAACVAGIFSLQDALEVVVARGKLMQGMKAGNMLAVNLPENEIRERLPKNIEIAAVNTPTLCVVSGTTRNVARFQQKLAADSVQFTILHTSHAFHSKAMEPVLKPFEKIVAEVDMNPPQIPLVSNVSGDWLTAKQATDPRYWSGHIRNPVRMADCIATLLADPVQILIEVGPGHTLSTFVRQHPNRTKDQLVVQSVRHASIDDDDAAFFQLALGRLWCEGFPLDRDRIFQRDDHCRVSLPTYPFQRKRFWLETQSQSEDASDVTYTPVAESIADAQSINSADVEVANCSRQNLISAELCSILQDLSGIQKGDLDVNASFIEMGFDSLFLTRANTEFKKACGVDIGFRQLFEEAPSISALAEYIDNQLPDDSEKFRPPEVVSTRVDNIDSIAGVNDGAAVIPLQASIENLSGNGTDYAQVFTRQLEVIQDQLNTIRSLQQAPLDKTPNSVSADGVLPTGTYNSPFALDVSTVIRSGSSESRPVGPWKPIATGDFGQLSLTQQDHLSSLIGRLAGKLRKSKEHTQAHRRHLADPRTVAGFRRIWKELVYPVVVDRSEGAKVWDLDGNEYTDFAMGFGVAFLGHNPAFVIDAVREQLTKGVEIGPQHPLAGEVAKMICDFTGMERAAFCNTGSEAVLAAIRMARTVTGKNRIAVFAGDYHGIFDEVLARRVDGEQESRSVPVAPGIPGWSVEQTLVLEHGNPLSFEMIREHADDLAAVIVEPVQSRHPDLQPKEYLRELSKLTTELNVPLVLDEIITGFRCHPGGIQALWGVEADIATYGKAIGGGFPIAVVAGKRQYMDVLDGGHWQYGDDSFPETGVTWFAGTFVRHPVALAATKAALEHLKEQGASLQEQLNDTTKEMVDELNAFLDHESAPIHIETFASLFHIKFEEHQEISSLLYAHLRDNGIHLTEGRVSFLSTAHTAEQIVHFKNAFKTSVSALQSSGFLPILSVPIKDEPLDSEHWGGLSTKLGDCVADLEHWETDLTDELNIATLDAYPGVHEKLDSLCAALASEYLRCSNLDLCVGSEHSIESLRSGLGVLPDFDRFVVAMLLMLQEDGAVALDVGQCRVLPAIESIRPSSEIADEIRSAHPQFCGLVDMLQHCASNYRDALSGQVHSISVLLPDGRRDFVKQKLTQETAEYRQLRIYERLAAEFVVNLAKKRPLRILEVGAGGGDLTWQIVSRIRDLHCVYHYSDIAPVFVADARERVAQDGLDFVRCDALDISEDPASQGFPAEQYDVVLGLNVVHATPDITVSMNHMKDLLAPGGMLCLVELVQPTRWEHMIWGLAKGWWLFDDSYRQDQPLLPLETWRAAIEPLGFQDFVALPAESNRHDCSDSALLIASKDQAVLDEPVAADSLTRDGSKQLPLLEGQTEIWLAAMLSDDANRAFNLTNILRLNGALDVACAKEAIQELVNRHEALRTHINEDGSGQTICNKLQVSVAVHDLSVLAPPAREQELERILENASAEPFDLGSAPLFRPQIVKLSAREHVVLLTVHHIICDGWSTGILIRELGEQYQNKLQGVSDLPLPEHQLSDFVSLSQSEKFGKRLEKAQLYWLDKLSGSLPVLSLPTDRNYGNNRSFAAGRVDHKLDSKLIADIRQFSRRNNTTLFSTLLAAYVVFLSRLSRQHELIVGVSTAQQPAMEMPNLVSHCVNMLPLRFDVDPKSDFEKFLAIVKYIILDAFDNQECTYGRLLPHLKIDRSAGRPPLISTVFNLDPSMLDIEFDELHVQSSSAPRKFEIFELFFNVVLTDSSARIECTYNTDLYDDGTIRNRLVGFCELLDSICGNSCKAIGELNLNTDSDRSLLRKVNDTELDIGHDLLAKLFANSESDPDRPAIEFDGTETSYGSLQHQANQMANFLHETGVNPGSLVGVHMARSADMLVAMLGIMKAGCAYLPLDPGFPAERLEFMLADSGTQLLITQASLLTSLPGFAGSTIAVDRDAKAISTRPTSPPELESDPGALAYVLYTSGSTGRPKGVMVPHSCVINFLSSMAREPGLSADDSLLAVTTTSFDISALELFLPLTVGAKVIIASSEDAADGARLNALLEHSGATVLQATPTTWRMLLDAGWAGGQNFKALCGGEPLPQDLARELIPVCGELWNLYGPTETTIWSSCIRITDVDAPITIGRPIANTQIYVLDDDQRLQPIGVPGELCIAGAGVSLGYMNDPEMTSAAFIPNPYSDEPDSRLYRTGDLARWRSDGTLQHLGRIDGQVKIRGFRIELGEIESILTEHDSVKAVACNVWQVASDDQRLVAHIVPVDNQPLFPTELRKHLRSKVPDYMVPQHFEQIESIPLTSNAKIDRKALPSPARSSQKTDTYEPPQTATEKIIAAIWCDIVGVEKVGRHDFFFDIGGHSLLAVRAAAEMENQLGERPNLRDIILEDISQIAARYEPPDINTSVSENDRRSIVSMLFGR